ncbi:MAG: DUF11 domain-containing protein [Acidobacteria bacterium]|nr:DUF11 domain-containing protein [Acidobacteriota bacterium]
MMKRTTVVLIVVAISIFAVGEVRAQAIMGTVSDGNLAVVFPTPGAGLPNPAQVSVTGLPVGAGPHGVDYFGSDSSLITDAGASRVFVVQISTASLVDTISTAGSGWAGWGTIAVSPTLTAALGCGGSASLAIIAAPFGAGSTVTSLILPGSIATYQTQAIVFNSAGRAFVYHTTGISVIDPPYTGIAFTIPVSGNGISGAIAISPDGNTLMVTKLSTAPIDIFTAPFSAASTPDPLTIPGGAGLDGIMIAHDGSYAVVGDAFAVQVFSVASPFSSASTVESIPLPPAMSVGFEDVGISADSSLAIITGNSSSGAPAAFIEAPFNAAGATTYSVDIIGPGRGAGAVRFLPPGLAAGLTITKSAPATVAPGSALTYTITYGNSGGADATNVVIRDTVPTGTTFVSATDGGTEAGGVVTWNIGTVGTGVVGQTVSFTVTVTAPAGATVANDSYTIEGDGIPAIPGPPIFTSVTAGALTVTIIANPTIGPAPLTVAFNGSASGGVPPYTWAWDFGDTNTSTAQNPMNTYGSPGVYTVNLTATDAAGVQGAAAPVDITVIDEAQAIPTMQTWGILLLVALIGGAAVIRLRF